MLRYHDHVFPVAAGTWDGDPSADVTAVLDAQHYRLAGWRERDEFLNYRRFFDVDSLIAVRVEEPDVFDATHRVLIDLNHAGIIDGLRIDHPDGLADPEGYLERLRAALPARRRDLGGEDPRGRRAAARDWACDGTTGYDALPRRSPAPSSTGRPGRRRPTPGEATGGDPSLEHTTRVQAARRRGGARPRAPPAGPPGGRGAPRRRPGPAGRRGHRAAGRLRGLPRLREHRTGPPTTWPGSASRTPTRWPRRPAPTSPTSSAAGRPGHRPRRRRGAATSRSGSSRPGDR